MGFILPEILGSLRGDLGPWRALKVAQDEQFSELVQSIQRCSLDQHLSYKSKGVSGAPGMRFDACSKRHIVTVSSYFNRLAEQ